MRGVFSCTAVIFLFIGCSTSKLNRLDTAKFEKLSDLKEWNIDSPLVWKDFKGRPPLSEYEAVANSRVEIVYWDTVLTKMKVKIYAAFNKATSWLAYGAGGEHLLKHEQYHFNISELFARLIRHDIAVKHIEELSPAFWELIKKRWLELDKMQKDYDNGSNHSKNIEGQKKWEEYIDKQLKKFGEYTIQK